MVRTTRSTSAADADAEPQPALAKADPEPALAGADPEPAKKKPGRPRKQPKETAPTATDSTSAAVPTKKPAKRAIPSNTGDPKDDAAPPAKRTKASQTAGRTSPQRDPLPSRPRNSHPGKPDAPRPKRSSAEVQAALKELQAIEARKAEIQARQIQLYAELEMAEEASQEAESRKVVRSLTQVREDGPEEFSFSKIDAEDSEEEEDEEEGQRGATKGKGTKERPKKGVRTPHFYGCITKLISAYSCKSKLKAGDLRPALDAVKNDLHASKRKALTEESRT